MTADLPLALDHRPGPGPLVVLLHSGVTDRRAWAGALPASAATLTYDRRGFGQSAPAADGEFTHLADLRALLADVATGPAWLVGNSMGGGLALDVAVTAPELVAGLVLLAPAVSGAPEPVEDDPRTLDLDERAEAAAEAGDVEAAVELDAQLWLDGPTSPVGRVGGEVRELFRAMDGTAHRNRAAWAGHADADAWSRLGELDLPVVLATGDLDCGYLQHRTEELLAQIPGARRADLPGVAHLPSLERPDLVRTLVEEAVRTA
ncbi:alpha/beta fold hydrolase [Kineococcus sp. TBRC 1896]|uniref:Alpha/beta fold hydrolase n=1 Tax=Kineococcus mangrovi TaxID=1660183 RepID=A0ABV4I187_9ACTN